jgi:hypothetical protein
MEVGRDDEQCSYDSDISISAQTDDKANDADPKPHASEFVSSHDQQSPWVRVISQSRSGSWHITAGIRLRLQF